MNKPSIAQPCLVAGTHQPPTAFLRKAPDSRALSKGKLAFADHATSYLGGVDINSSSLPRVLPHMPTRR